MPHSRIRPCANAATSSISLSAGAIRIRDDATFRLGTPELCRRFLSRVFSLEEVRSVSVDCAMHEATIRHRVDRSVVPQLLSRLSAALRSELANSWPMPPIISARSTFSVHRHGSRLSTWEVVVDQPGRLRIRHEALKGDSVVADRLEREFRSQSGIRVVMPSERSGHLLVRYDPAVISSRVLLALAEMCVIEPEPEAAAKPATIPVKFTAANWSLGIAAAGEFLLPIFLPISAVLLVGTNIDTFKAARQQLEKKRLGLPVLYLVIIATTLATGQFVASALMTWFFRFWHRRFRVDLAAERTRLLDQARNTLTMARLITPSGAEVLVTVESLQPGDRVVVAANEVVPADGRVFGGEGVVDERGVHGLEGISRKRVDDRLLAGSAVLAGAFYLEVIRVGEQTRASAIRKALVAATSPTPGVTAPTIRSEMFASKAVGPTLATAGLGLLAGDLMTVAAILRPDYATGPGLAVPLEILHNVARCARLGVVARDPEALERLAEVNLFVIEDHPVLAATEFELTRVETRLPEATLLRYAASAFRHLVDDRAKALVSACRDRKIHLLNLEVADFGRGLAVTHGKHKIRVLDAEAGSHPATPLAVELDGEIVGRIEFGPTNRLQAAAVIEHLRRSFGIPFALVSSRETDDVAGLAKALGVEMYRGNFQPEHVAAFLTACRGKGIKTAFVGDCRAQPNAAAEAYVSISWADDADMESNPAGLLMQPLRFEPLGQLVALSRSHASRVNQAQQFMLLPNLICVAGAFFFGFTGLTAVMLSNLGTLGLYRHASDSLRGLESMVPHRMGQITRSYQRS